MDTNSSQMASSALLARDTGGHSPLFIVAFCLIILYSPIKAVYNIYLHPLSKFPGPLSAAATKIPIALVAWKGTKSHWQKNLHEQYQSEVVRISPDELSFIGPSAWKDLYGYRPGHQRFQKDMLIFAGIDNLVTASDADHSRIRRLVAHAFSDKALREQESLIQIYVDNLIVALKSKITTSENGEVELKDLFQYTAFDVISDLSFGQPFNCLKESRYHPWVAMLMNGLKHVVYLSVVRRFPPMDRLLSLYIPKEATRARNDHDKLAAEKVEQRLNTETERPDFLSYILKHNEGGKEAGGMTRQEIDQNAAAFIGAGAETSAGVMCATVWLLLTHPPCMKELHAEIRAYKNKEDINLKNIDQLRYFQAIIDESLRIYPPALAGQARIAPVGGDTVSGHWVPGGTGVQLNQYAAFHSNLNFTSPEVFAPSRWLGDKRFANDKLEVVQPFSIGARNCIGKNLALAEIRLVLAHLMWTFDLEICEKTEKDWLNQKEWFTWAKKPLWVKLSPRAV